MTFIDISLGKLECSRISCFKNHQILMQALQVKVHITPLTKFRPETPYGVKTLHAKYFQNRNCGFPTI